MDLSSYRPVLVAFGAVLSGIGGLWWAVSDTPPNRASVEKSWNEHDAAKELARQATKQEEERTEQMRIAAKAGLPLPRVAVASHSSSSGTCISPYHGQTKFEAPIRLSAGECAKLPSADAKGMHFWAVFQSVPQSMAGVADVATVRYNGNVTPDGSRDLELEEECRGPCKDFVLRNLGKPLMVRQVVGQPLDIKL